MFTFTLFNVGHGFCAYATTPGGSTILFDCGYDDELQFYPSRYFSDRNIANIHSLALSHFDQDHVANLPALRKAIKFNTITRNRTLPVDFIRKQKRVAGELLSQWRVPLTCMKNGYIP